MKRTKNILLLIGFFVSQITFAQHMFQTSQYMFNDYALNPAIGGTHDYWQIKTNYRMQWAGVPDGPQTFMLGGYGPHKTMPMGYGGYIFSDIVGPLSYTGAYGSYSYNLRISGDIRLSMGLFAGIVQHKIDFSSLRPDDPEEPMLLQNSPTKSKFIPDGSLGLYLYTSQYFFGLSFNHMFFNNMTILDNYKDSISYEKDRIRPYFNIQGGYRYNLNRYFDLQPSVLMKVAPNYDFMTDINIRAIYQKMVWGGLGFRYCFRNPESVVVFVGYNYSDLVNIGYSFDWSISKFGMTSGNYGSHEIMIGVKFDDIRKSKSRRKIR